MLGSQARASYQQQGMDLKVKLEGEVPANYAMGLKISPVPWQMVRE